jgi:methionine-S-sulfoxide reductase
MEEILRNVKGVRETQVGYTGGKTSNPLYTEVKTGQTAHAEAIKLIYDPSVISYESLLKNYFFKMHDPTTLNQQGNDKGSQYRSAIFYLTEEQHQTALKVKREIELSGKWKKPLVTEINRASTFYAAEEYHQDYLQKHPGGYTCHFMRD